jgi:hypothetical protein
MYELSFVAHLETSLSEQQLLNSLNIATGVGTPLITGASLEASHPGSFLLYGTLPTDQPPDLWVAPLVEMLQQQKIHFHIDIFEEDGRLIRRFQDF